MLDSAGDIIERRAAPGTGRTVRVTGIGSGIGELLTGEGRDSSRIAQCEMGAFRVDIDTPASIAKPQGPSEVNRDSRRSLPVPIAFRGSPSARRGLSRLPSSGLRFRRAWSS